MYTRSYFNRAFQLIILRHHHPFPQDDIHKISSVILQNLKTQIGELGDHRARKSYEEEYSLPMGILQILINVTQREAEVGNKNGVHSKQLVWFIWNEALFIYILLWFMVVRSVGDCFMFREKTIIQFQAIEINGTINVQCGTNSQKRHQKHIDEETLGTMEQMFV